MRKIVLVFTALLLNLLISTPSAAQWQQIYETDFSSDPGWTTNNNSNFYWDATDGTYYIDQVNVNGGGYYSYYDVSALGYHGGMSFRLEWDIMILSNDYASDVSFGVFDSDLNTNENGSYIRLMFTREDRGRITILQWGDSSDNISYVEELKQFSLNTWYHVIMEYNSSTGTLTVEIGERDTGTQYASLNATNVGPFASDMVLLGSSNVRSGSFQVPGAHSIGKIDNVVFSIISEQTVEMVIDKMEIKLEKDGKFEIKGRLDITDPDFKNLVVNPQSRLILELQTGGTKDNPEFGIVGEDEIQLKTDGKELKYKLKKDEN